MTHSTRPSSRVRPPGPRAVAAESLACCRCHQSFTRYDGSRRRICPACRPAARPDLVPVPYQSLHRPGMSLSPRQRQVAELAARGLPSKEIAYHLKLAYGTVKVMLTHIYLRTGCPNRVALARMLWEQGREAQLPLPFHPEQAA